MNTESAMPPGIGSVSAAERARIAQITRDAWRELGFWYECDFAGKRWRIRADRNGLRAFAGAIRNFLGSSGASEPGDHLHLGPFANLRIMRAERGIVSWRAIGGAPADLERLVAELESLAADLEPTVHARSPGGYELCADFAHDDGFRMFVQAEPDGFDPASADDTRI